MFAAVGLAALGLALLVPAYFRSLDAAVASRAGDGSRNLVLEVGEQVRLDKPGRALLLAQAAMAADVAGAARLVEEAQQFVGSRTMPGVWGGADSLLRQVCGSGQTAGSPSSVMDVVLPEAQRATVFGFLRGLRRVDVHELLKNRNLERTVIFPPATSPSGQALDAAILTAGLLVQADAFAPRLRQEIEELAAAANRGYDSGPIEVFYLDLTSLAKRTTWDQLLGFLQRVRNLRDLRQLSRTVTLAPADLPVLFAALHLSEAPDAVPEYLRTFPQTAMRDLRFGLGKGKGALDRMLERQQPIYYGAWRAGLLGLPGLGLLFKGLTSLAYNALALALLLKYLLWFDGAFCLARAFSLLKPAPSELERRLIVPKMVSLRQQSLAALAVAVGMAVVEPGLARAQVPPQPALWTPSRTNSPPAPAAELTRKQPSMNKESNLLALVVFFAVQLTVYIVGLIKLREIKRQPISSTLKIRILDNEENLFDAGLYLGLAGTGLSLVLLAMELFSASPMIAYASTGFGVVFAALLKIVHVRSYRRLLLLQAEMEAPQPMS